MFFLQNNNTTLLNKYNKKIGIIWIMMKNLHYLKHLFNKIEICKM